MKKIFNRNICLMYLISIFNGFTIAYVIERLFWEQRGMTPIDVVITEIIYAVLVILFEVPSGVLADKYGRKKLVAFKGFTSVVEFIMLLFAHHRITFYLAVAFSGIGHSFSSGSREALIYDSLKELKDDDNYEKTYGRIEAIDTASSVLAALVGGLLAYLVGSYELNYIISIIMRAAALICMLCLKEPKRFSIDDDKDEKTSFFYYIKTAISFFKEHHIAFYYAMVGCVVGSCCIYIDEFWQLLIKKINVPIYLFGFVSVSFMIFKVPGYLLVEKIKNSISYNRFFAAIPFLFGITYIILSQIENYFMFLPLACIGIFIAITEPIVDGYIQKKIKGNVRATVESIYSMLFRFVTMILGIVFGIASKKNVFTGFLALGLICIIYGFVNIVAIRKNTDNHEASTIK